LKCLVKGIHVFARLRHHGEPKKDEKNDV